MFKPMQKVNEFRRSVNNLPGDEKLESKDQLKVFKGNSLEKRKSGNLPKYKNTAKLSQMMEDEFRNVSGTQKKACDMTNCNDKSFSRWINASAKNNALFHEWKNSIADDERDMLREQINKYFRN